MAAGLVSLGKNAGGWANNACEKGEQWQHVLDLFEKMRCESVQRVALTYSAAISACLNGEQWQKALDTSSLESLDGCCKNSSVIILHGIRR